MLVSSSHGLHVCCSLLLPRLVHLHVHVHHVRPCVVVSVLARLRFLKTSQRKLSCVLMKLL